MATKAKTRGRKKMSRSKKLNNMYSFSVRLDNKTALRLESMIQESGMRRATFLREVLLNHINGTSNNSTSANPSDIDSVLKLVKTLYNADITIK